MEISIRLQVAETLRRAAEGAVSEEEFWERFRNWSAAFDDPRIMMAWEQAEHFWANFHARNLLLMHVKPDPLQVEHGQEVFRLLAQAFEEDWSEERVEQELNRI